MLAPKVIFWFFSILMIGSAFVVVHGKNLVRSAFSLLATFFSVAAFYVMLGAEFLAGVQLLVYVGGILTLLLFGVMLTNRIYNLDLRSAAFQVVPGALVSGLVFLMLLAVIFQTPWQQAILVEETTTSLIGRALMTEYVLPFEVASVLLLVALLGAAMLVRRRTDL